MTTRLRIGSRSIHKNVAYKVLTFSILSLTAKFEEGPLDLGLKLGWGGSCLRNAISRKRCEIELR